MIAGFINLITFKIPYYGIYALTKVCGKNVGKSGISYRLKNLKTPTILPDGNIIICSLEDHLYEREVYHNSPYDRFFKPQTGDIVVDVGAGIERVDLLKINVEGAELPVLRGCKKFLYMRKISKIIATPHPPFKREARKIRNYIKRFGYKVEVSVEADFLYAFLA
jgi:hypothetical protein